MYYCKIWDCVVQNANGLFTQLLQFLLSIANHNSRAMPTVRKRHLMINSGPDSNESSLSHSPAKLPNMRVDDSTDHDYTVHSVSKGWLYLFIFTKQTFQMVSWKKMKIENCTILIPKGNSCCRRKSSARGLRFEVSSEGLSTEMDILIWSPNQVQRPMLLTPSVPGRWP